MAINPMQRKARNSFFAGFFISLIIGGLVSFLFYRQMTQAQSEYEKLNNSLIEGIYIAPKDMSSGEEFDISDLETDTIKTSLDMSELISAEDFTYEDSDDGEIYTKKMVLKIDVPMGTIITKDMLAEADNTITSSQRMQEYNMIILPTLLEEGDYIDIRLQLPEGDDYIVVSRKKVLRSTADTIWLNMNEDEILMLGNAIVEAYTMTGSKLYATLYTQPGIQDAVKVTYLPSEKVANLMVNNPNILEEARNGLKNRYDSEVDRSNRSNIDGKMSEYSENMNDLVETGIQEEITKLQTSRQEYVESLQGGAIDTVE